MNDVALAAFRTRITRVYPAQIRAAIEPLSDEQLWWRPNEKSNSIANLILHLTGSLNHFLNRNLGGLAYERDRPAEFAERNAIPRSDLLARFDEMVRNAERTFDGLTPDSLDAPSPEPGMHTLVVEDLINVATHMSTHMGQIIWIAKMLNEEALNEVWMKTHRSEGAWKKR
ncbi:MAG TPA: DinB family protein [Thermoanaerobaculia bacterium]|nr:DinB family protein [Thermoanaerobaculia bacterium]